MNFWVLEIFRDFPRPPRPRKIEKNRKNPEIHENPVLVTGVLRLGVFFIPDSNEEYKNQISMVVLSLLFLSGVGGVVPTYFEKQ